MGLNIGGIVDAYSCWQLLELSYGRDKTGVFCLCEYLRSNNLMKDDDIETFKNLLLKVTEKKIEKKIRRDLGLDRTLEELREMGFDV